MKSSSKPHINSSLGKNFLYTLIIYFLFILFLLVLEISFRTFLPPVSSLGIFLEKGPIPMEIRGGNILFEGDPLLGWRLRSNLREVWWDYTIVSTNGQNLRHPREITYKNKGDYRILCLGDSITFGYRVPVSFDNKNKKYNPSMLPFPRILEKMLKEKFPKKNIEVISMAVPGYSSYQGLAWLKRDISFFAPDLIISSFGWNDCGLGKQEDKDSLPDNAFLLISRTLVLKSYLAMYLTKFIKENIIGKNTNNGRKLVPRVSSKDYLNNMLEISKIANRHGAKMLFLGTVLRDLKTIPDHSKRVVMYRDNLSNLCQQNSIPYLEIRELTEKNSPGNKHLFGELIHPGHLGHVLIADKLMDFLPSLFDFRKNKNE